MGQWFCEHGPDPPSLLVPLSFTLLRALLVKSMKFWHFILGSQSLTTELKPQQGLAGVDEGVWC